MNENNPLTNLEVLERDGNQLLKGDEDTGQMSTSVKIWLAGVSNVLKLVLPKDSSLLEVLPELAKVESTPDQESRKSEIKDTVERTLQIIKYAKMSVAEPIEKVLERHLQELESKGGVIENALESKRATIESEINNNIIAGYFNSWTFRIPVGILFIAIIFAIFGIMRIQQYELNLQDITDKSIERAKQEIILQTEVINSSLNTFAESEQNKIKQSVTSHIETLIDEKAPEADAVLTSLAERVSTIETDVENLENRSERLMNTAEIINASPPTALDAAGLLLKKSSWLLWVIIVVSGISIVHAGIALIKGLR